MKTVAPESLMERVTMSRSGCWVWEGARSKEGYGVVRLDDGQRQTPRLFWETFVGPVPAGYTVRSKKLPACAGKACCNPAHHRLQGPVVATEISACKKGHLLTADNMVIENRNGRVFKRCRICRREAWKGWQKQHSSPAESGKKTAT